MSTKPLVLVVDDDTLMRHLMRDALETVECEIREVKDGDEAIQAIEERIPDVMLLDLFMPKRSGLDVLKLIFPRKLKTKIFVVSSMDTTAMVNQAMAMGASGFLAKNPLHPLEVRSAVLGALSQNGALAS